MHFDCVWLHVTRSACHLCPPSRIQVCTPQQRPSDLHITTTHISCWTRTHLDPLHLHLDLCKSARIHLCFLEVSCFFGRCLRPVAGPWSVLSGFYDFCSRTLCRLWPLYVNEWQEGMKQFKLIYCERTCKFDALCHSQVFQNALVYALWCLVYNSSEFQSYNWSMFTCYMFTAIFKLCKCKTKHVNLIKPYFLYK